jgi:hypothetical protein
MRIFVIVLSAGLVFSGCAKMKSLLPSAPDRNSNAAAATETPKPIVTLANSNPGRVASVNPDGRFTILTFPFGAVPGTGQRLNVYRNGIKAAEVKVTGPQRGINTVADIISGEVLVNDEVRAD